MNLSLQPLSLAPSLSQPMGLGGFSSPALERAIATEPLLASKAAAQLASLSPAQLHPLSPQSNLNPLDGKAVHSDAELRKVSKNFESIFMDMLFKEMRNTVQKSDIWGNSPALDFFETMRDEQMSEALASAGGIGIGKMIYQKLKAATAPHLKTST